MRKRLQRFCGQRIACVCIFLSFAHVRPDTQRSWHTMLVQDVMDMQGRVLCQHTWVKLDGIVPLQLTTGQRITFTADVTTYLKGERGKRRLEYGLARPRNIRIVDEAQGQQQEEERGETA